MEDNKIDQIFKKGLSKRQIMPTTDMWSHIDDHLDKPKSIMIFKPWKYVAAACAILLVGSVWMMNREEVNPNIVEVKDKHKADDSFISQKVAQSVTKVKESEQINNAEIIKIVRKQSKKTSSPLVYSQSKKTEYISVEVPKDLISLNTETIHELVDINPEMDSIKTQSSNIKLKKLRKSDIKVLKMANVIDDNSRKDGSKIDNLIASVSDFATPIIHSIAERNYSDIGNKQ